MVGHHPISWRFRFFLPMTSSHVFLMPSIHRTRKEAKRRTDEKSQKRREVNYLKSTQFKILSRKCVCVFSSLFHLNIRFWDIKNRSLLISYINCRLYPYPYMSYLPFQECHFILHSVQSQLYSTTLIAALAVKRMWSLRATRRPRDRMASV